MKKHPYRSLPDQAFWRRSIAECPPEAVDPVGSFELRITPASRVATAGSCFAQHIARHLALSGFCYHVAEPGHPLLPDDVRKEQQYGTFSARYGNIYTARQLRQLLDRALGRFVPVEDAWIEAADKVLDPFRPNVQPGGFVSVAEMRADRAQHLAAVRRMFETLDVFVFTLGLTECWASREDGAVFPVCPGVEGGMFDPERHVFLNQSVAEVIEDIDYVYAEVRRINPAAQFILTVSPVPLVATAAPGQHVLAATTYSKSVLRVAAETLCRAHAAIHYFPSYEIITGSFNRGRYFAADLRSVTEEGVAHVMRLFLAHAGDSKGGLDVSGTAARQAAATDFERLGQALVEVECDELALDRPAPKQ
ncbi:MAG: GSCFA domain-containing protein [Rubrivivax sp.]|nr:GSCFA domain-containing protein [Rubrivivax sp.]